MGDVTLTISPSCACTVSVQPTPQYEHIVSPGTWGDSCHGPASRISCSVLNLSAPVGQTPMQLPQYTQAESGSGTANSVEMRASNPRPATPIAEVCWASSPHDS